MFKNVAINGDIAFEDQLHEQFMASPLCGLRCS